MSQQARRSRVSTYLGPRTFYKKDMEKKDKAGQAGQQLPPRCAHCRVSWNTIMIEGVAHCVNHSALGTCTAGCDTPAEHDDTVASDENVG